MYTQQAVKCPQVALLEQGFKAIIYTLINIVAKIIEGGGGGNWPLGEGGISQVSPPPYMKPWYCAKYIYCIAGYFCGVPIFVIFVVNLQVTKFSTHEFYDR